MGTPSPAPPFYSGGRSPYPEVSRNVPACAMWIRIMLLGAAPHASVRTCRRSPRRDGAAHNDVAVRPGGVPVSQEAMEVVLNHLHARRRPDIDAVAATLDPEAIHQGVRPALISVNREAGLGI